MISIDHIEEFRQTELPIVIYGADLVGKAMYNACKSLGIKVECFCDDSIWKIELSGTPIVFGLDVVEPAKLRDRFSDAHFLVSSTYINDIIGHLESLGFDKWYDCSLLRGFDCWADQYTDSWGKRTLLGAFVDFTVNACLLSHEGYLNKDKLFVRCVDLVITEKCSLKCRDCSNLMQYYLKPKNYSLEDTLRSIDLLCEQVDEIYEMRVIGGEPFMNKDTHLIIERLAREEKIKRIVIYTNGTIPLRREQISSFVHDKIMFLLTDYSQSSALITRQKSTSKIDQLEAQLKENGIDYDRKPVGGWVDCATIDHYERTPEENQKVFDYCCAKNNVTLMAGDSKLYNCPFAANGYTLGAFPSEIANEGIGDIIDISEKDDDIKNKIHDFVYRKDFVSACDYCAGREYEKPEIVPAVQTLVPLKYKKYV